MINHRLITHKFRGHRVPINRPQLLSNIRVRSMIQNVNSRRRNIVRRRHFLTVQLPTLDVLHILRGQLQNVRDDPFL